MQSSIFYDFSFQNCTFMHEERGKERCIIKYALCTHKMRVKAAILKLRVYNVKSIALLTFRQQKKLKSFCEISSFVIMKNHKL